MKRILATLAIAAALTGTAQAADITLLNVSYDPTRELHAALSKAFAAAYKTADGKTVEIKSSHGGLRQAGARGDRRPAGRHRDARACL